MPSILPKKHVTLEQSILGFGAQIIGLIDGNQSVDDLWKEYEKSKHTFQHSFEDYILLLDFLFLVGAVEVKGGIVKCLN